MQRDSLPAIATGNWGCGAFRGNPKLKVLIQLMAAAVAGRSMVYFTFGDTELRDSVGEMYFHLLDRNIDISRLFSLLRQYEVESTADHSDFYRFLFNRSKMKPLTNYFSVVKPQKSDKITNLREKSLSDVKLRGTSLQRAKLPEEEDEERIRKMLEDYANEPEVCNEDDSPLNNCRDVTEPEETECIIQKDDNCVEMMEEKSEIMEEKSEMMEEKSEVMEEKSKMMEEQSEMIQEKSEMMEEMSEIMEIRSEIMKEKFLPRKDKKNSRISPLDLFVSSDPTPEVEITYSDIPTNSPRKKSLPKNSKSPGKSAGKGQKKISDFFVLKTSLL